ncbi:MAG: aminotransferase class IV, partial [Myxococcota bacterium]
LCIVDDVQIYDEEKRARGIDLVTVSRRRPPANVLDPCVKSLNYLNSALAKLEARQRGADEALLLNQQGNVAEASVANVFMVQGTTLRTPPPTDGALAGITRASILEIAPGLGLRPEESSLGRVDLLGADELFLTGTGAGLVPVRTLDREPIGAGAPGPITLQLASALDELRREGGVQL